MDKDLEGRLAAKDSYITIHDFYVLMAFYQSISQKVLRKFGCIETATLNFWC